MFQYFISFYGWIIFHCIDIPHFINLLLRIWIVSILGLLWIMPLWTFVYKFLCGYMFSFLMGIYLGVKFLHHRVALCLIFWRITKLLFNFTDTIPPAIDERFNFSTSSWTLAIACLLILTILVGMKWHHIVVLICISLLSNDFRYIFMCLLATYISSLEKCLFKFFAYFLDWVVCWVVRILYIF